MSGGDLGVSTFPDGESIFLHGLVQYEGEKGILYDGLSYKISLRFPLDYTLLSPTSEVLDIVFSSKH